MKLRDRDADASDRRQRTRPRPDRRHARKAGCASARWCATRISPPIRACGATTACCPARCSPAPPGSCATRRRPPAICCNARAALISTTPTAVQQAPARQRLRGDRRRQPQPGGDRRERSLHRDPSQRHGRRHARARRGGRDGAAGRQHAHASRSPTSTACPATRRTSKRPWTRAN